MRLVNLLFSDLFLIIYLFYFIKEYYSISRLIKGLFNFLLEMRFKCIFLFLFFIFSILHFVFNHFIYIILSYVCLFIIIIYLPKIKFKLHKRGLRLLLLSIILNLEFLFLDYRYLHLLIFIMPLIAIIISNIFLFPFEEILRRKYIKMAQKKLKKIKPIIIGITGSFGKTTFKNYLYHFLKNKYNVSKSDGNINTLMGLTKWINSSLNPICDVIILEIGIDKYKGIRKFKKLFTLDIGVITSVGKMHLSTFKSYKRLVDSKCEIDLLLKENGILFLNNKHKELKNRSFNHKSIYYKNNLYDESLNNYQLTSLSGAIEIAKILNVDTNSIESSLKTIPNIERRFEIKKNDEMIVINDSYNSNLEGVKEALRYMKRYSLKKIIITGGLIELGKEFKIENYKLGLAMKEIDYLFLITNKKNHPLIKGFKKVSLGKITVVKSLEEAKKKIELIKGKKIVLLGAKGSDFFTR